MYIEPIIIESKHPYEAITEHKSVEFPGAQTITITFDPQCMIGSGHMLNFWKNTDVNLASYSGYAKVLFLYNFFYIFYIFILFLYYFLLFFIIS